MAKIRDLPVNNKIKFSKYDYKESVKKYIKNWTLNDDTLYSLCKKNYAHNTMNAINAKLWIIGRAYATGIERKILTDGSQGGSLAILASHVYRNKRKVADIFGQLGSLCRTQTLNAERLKVIVDLHGQLVGLINEVTRDKQSVRSFVSKYMHFHCPLVPIYDSLARAGLNQFGRLGNNQIAFNMPANADREYYKYALKFWALYKEAPACVAVKKVKRLDRYLLDIAEQLKGRNR